MVGSNRGAKVFRAHLDDVENLSYGKGAKKQRGTGSRFTCHRLNREERQIFDRAKRDGYLTVRGNGYRKERKGSPVWNTHRQRCDALKEPCVVVEKRSDSDRVVVDLSTLRVPDDAKLVEFLLEEVFKPNYPEFFEAILLAGMSRLGGDRKGGQSSCEESDGHEGSVSLPKADNTTHRPIDWETVATKPIWGVDERLIAVSCDRDTAKSIARDVLGRCGSVRFAMLLADAENTPVEITTENIPAEGDPTPTVVSTQREEEWLEVPTETMLCGVGCDDKKQRRRIPESLGKTSCNHADQINATESVDTDCIDWNDI